MSGKLDRVNFWLIILSYLLASVCAMHTFPVTSLGYENGLHDVNDIDSTSTNNGGCALYRYYVEAAWLDAMSMINAGLCAATKICDTIEVPSASNQQQYNEWLRITQPFKALFGNANSLEELKVQAREVEKNYYNLFIIHRVRTGHDSKFDVRCDDRWLQYKDKTFKDPRQTGNHSYTIGNPTEGLHPYPNGAFYLPGVRPKYSLHWDEDVNKPTDVHPLCLPGSLLTSIYWVVIFCDAVLNVGAVNWDLPGWESRLQRGTSIDDTSTIGGRLWLQEMFEYAPPLKETFYPPTRWTGSVGIAGENPTAAAQSPEAYVYYALSMYLNGWYWGTGRAMPDPEVEPFDPHPTKSDKKGKEKSKSPIRKFKDMIKGKAGSSKSGRGLSHPHARRIVTEFQPNATTLE